MKIRKVTIKNFRAIEGTIEFNNRSGVGLPLLIHGRNAVGKTTIFDCLTLLLFRVIDRKGRINQGFRLDSLINNDAQEMYVSADLEGMFRLNPELPPQKCTLRFTCKQHKTPHNTNPASQIQYRVIDVETEEELSIPIVTNCTGNIIGEAAEGFQTGNRYNHLLEMDYTAFRSSIFIAQDGFSRFFENKDARQAIITQLLNVQFNQEEEKIGNIARSKRAILRIKNKRLEELNIGDTFDSWNHALDSVCVSIQQCEQVQNELQFQITQGNQEVGALSARYQQYEEHISVLQEFIQSVQDLEQKEEELLGAETQERWEHHTAYSSEERSSYWLWKKEFDHEPGQEQNFDFHLHDDSNIVQIISQIESETKELMYAKSQAKKLEESIQREIRYLADLQAEIIDKESSGDVFSDDEHRAYLNDIGSVIGVDTSWETIQKLHPALQSENAENKEQVHQSIVRDFEYAVVQKEQELQRKERLKNLRIEQKEKQEVLRTKQETLELMNESICTQLSSLSQHFAAPITAETSLEQLFKELRMYNRYARMKPYSDLLLAYDWDDLCANILSKEEERIIQNQRESIEEQEQKINVMWSELIHPNLITEAENHRNARLELCTIKRSAILSIRGQLQ